MLFELKKEKEYRTYKQLKNEIQMKPDRLNKLLCVKAYAKKRIGKSS